MCMEERLLRELEQVRKELTMRQAEISEQQTETATNINRILFILESDPKINNKGLVERVNDSATDIIKLQEFKKEISLKAKIYGGIAGAVAGFLGYILKLILNL